MDQPELSYDIGTAYDLFISLLVLHEPARFGLRGAWAAGVRSRLPAGEREFLQKMTEMFPPPLAWVYSLLLPKDGATLLETLAAMAPRERTATIGLPLSPPEALYDCYRQVSERGRWDEADKAVLESFLEEPGREKGKKPDAETVLAIWADADAFGERYLAALRSYYELFFAEEEARIKPALEAGLARAQALAETLPVRELLVELTEGVHFAEAFNAPELVLVPSFWAPLLILHDIDARRNLFVYLARPAEASLVPGEPVPDALLAALKALADPTRLRILRHLMAEPLAPSELARRLRLRPPTVIHHLDALRLARLVTITIDKDDQRLYTARGPALEGTWQALRAFVGEADTGEA